MSRKRRLEDVLFVYYEDTELSSIPNGITSLRIDSSVKKIPPGAFREHEKLEAVEYEEGLEVIGEHVFECCSILREQQFPSTLIEIGKYAFHNCKKLESVGRLPLSLKIIRECAFFGCTKLQSVDVHDTIRLEAGVFMFCTSLTRFSLPRGMVKIPYHLFFNCTSLVDVTVPLSVIEIGKAAFAACNKLAMIELPSGLKTIGDKSFYGCGFKHFHFPARVESVGKEALTHCKSMESVILPPKLEAISDSTFEGCLNLKDISIPKSVVRVGKSAFAKCGLTQLDLSGSNITNIGESAFSGCSNLKEIGLPRTTLTKIEDQSFQNCTSLTHLWVPPTVEYIGGGSFAGCTSLLSVEVPESLKRLVFICQDYGYTSDEADIFVALCGYRSLVNIYLPPSHQLDRVDDYDFMEEMKLGEVEGKLSGACPQTETPIQLSSASPALLLSKLLFGPRECEKDSTYCSS